MTITRYLTAAQTGASIIQEVLVQRGLEPAIENFALTERNALAWLVAFLDLSKLQGRLEGYTSPDTLHHLSTALKGKPVILSNSSGVRYMVLLSPQPVLPKDVPYPEALTQRDVFPVGVGFYGPILAKASQLRNVLIAGEPGSGKSNFELILAQAARTYGWQLYTADPDGHTFNPDLWSPACVCPVAESPDELLVLLGSVQAELARRKALFGAMTHDRLPPADLDEYNRQALQPLPRLLLIVDEANSYFEHKDVLVQLEDLARRGRKWGLHIVLAAHNWRAKDVPRGLSAMFPTRACFRVNDDTSGAVVLDSRTWGKKAMRLRHPGRGILRLDGRCQLFQSFRLDGDLEGFPSVTQSNPLSNLELQLVQHAIEQLEGKFIVNRLAQAFAGQGISHHQVQKIALEFERRGWLSRPKHATDARCVTNELRVFAGLSRTGEQAVQDHTGVQELKI